eukprot:TRINITY_DN19685_c0_g2_i1.p1 TRINITY_DN19685_c0_g2~~TRINITY_DN19685_c0_g2_i1.p1  ORF type:complete len:362 (-),score=104.78 TRINITY_DN19685_c0_g2_i1:105-1190(-)
MALLISATSAAAASAAMSAAAGVTAIGTLLSSSFESGFKLPVRSEDSTKVESQKAKIRCQLPSGRRINGQARLFGDVLMVDNDKACVEHVASVRDATVVKTDTDIEVLSKKTVLLRLTFTSHEEAKTWAEMLQRAAGMASGMAAGMDGVATAISKRADSEAVAKLGIMRAAHALTEQQRMRAHIKTLEAQLAEKLEQRLKEHRSEKEALEIQLKRALADAAELSQEVSHLKAELATRPCAPSATASSIQDKAGPDPFSLIASTRARLEEVQQLINTGEGLAASSNSLVDMPRDLPVVHRRSSRTKSDNIANLMKNFEGMQSTSSFVARRSEPVRPIKLMASPAPVLAEPRSSAPTTSGWWV